MSFSTKEYNVSVHYYLTYSPITAYPQWLPSRDFFRSMLSWRNSEDGFLDFILSNRHLQSHFPTATSLCSIKPSHSKTRNDCVTKRQSCKFTAWFNYIKVSYFGDMVVGRNRPLGQQCWSEVEQN